MKRLQAYGVFSDETVRAIEKVEKAQKKFATYQDYFDSLGISKPRLFIGSKRRGVPVVDIPARAKNTKGVLVMHLPMSNPLDENQLFHVATVVSALPEYRVISFGNPSGKPYKYREQNRNLWQLLKIAFSKNRHALVSPEIDYLRKQGIRHAHHVGYSYGAQKALIEVGYLKPKEVASLALLDPVAHPRSAIQLLNDFKTAFKPMGGYVNRTELKIFFDARRDTSKTGHPISALRRPISIAIGILMARFDFMTHLKELLAKHKTVKVSVAWGSESELGNDAHMATSLETLGKNYPKQVKRLRLEGDKHAFANDIHLFAAIVYESLTTAP